MKIRILRPAAWLLAIWLGFAMPACKVQRLVSEIETPVDLRAAMETAGSSKVAWRIARRVDTFEGYRNFLLLYPNAGRAGEARERLQPYEEAVWAEVRWAMDEQARLQDYLLVKYLDLFPEGVHRQEAENTYAGMPDSACWYTLRFRDLSLAPFIFNRVEADSFNLHQERLEGLRDYLLRFPDGLLSKLMAERLAFNYLGYRLLPADKTVKPYLLPIEEGFKDQYMQGLRNYGSLPASTIGEAVEFLEYALDELEEIPVGDSNNDSILDELALPEVEVFPRRMLSEAEEEAIREEQQRLEAWQLELLYRQRSLQEELAAFTEEFEYRKERLSFEFEDQAMTEFDRIDEAIASLRASLSRDLPLRSFRELEQSEALLERQAFELEETVNAARDMFEVVSESFPGRDKEENEDPVTSTRPGTSTEADERPPGVLPLPPPLPPDEGQLTEDLLEARAEESMRSVTSGRFLYDSIPVLTVGKPFLFKLAIVPDSQIDTPTAPDLIDGEDAISRPIPISNEMSVRIVADRSAFNIQPVSDTIQPIDFQRGTLWSWQIIPLEPGSHNVIVSIDILTKSELTGDVRRKSVNVYDEEVEVIVEEREEEPSTGFGIDPLFLLLLLIPIGLLVFWWYRRKQTTGGETDQAFPGETAQERQFLQENREGMEALMEKAESWIANGETKRAFKALLDFFNNHHQPIHKELITLSARFNKYQREANLGLDPKESVLNRINLALIELMGRVRERVKQ